MMQFLGLHNFDETYPQLPPSRLSPLLSREALRRLAWAVFFSDTMADAGRHGVHLITEAAFYIQLPSDEESFTRGQDVITEPLRSQSSHLATQPPSPNIGISAHYVRTAALRRRVLHYNSSIHLSTDPLSKMLEELSAFEAEMHETLNALPESLAYNDANLFIHTPDRTAFVGLHMLRHNADLMLALAKLTACIKHQSQLGNVPGSTHLDVGEIMAETRRERLRHALPVSRIVGDMMRLGVNSDPSVNVQAYSSIESEQVILCVCFRDED